MKAKKDKKRTGPEPDRVKLTGDWERAVEEALRKKRPAGGWPDDAKPKKKPA
jgi:hypothetical protein